MKQASIIDDIHQIRKEHAEKFHNNLHAICEYARQKQRECGRIVVRGTPKLAKKVGVNNQTA